MHYRNFGQPCQVFRCACRARALMVMVMEPIMGLILQGFRRAITLKGHIITSRAHRARRGACRAQNDLSRSGRARPSRTLTFPTA